MQNKRNDLILLKKEIKDKMKKKYYIKYREKKRKENENEYLKNNAETAKNWRDNNKEHLAEWRAQNFAQRFGGIKSQAQKKGIIWNEDLTDEICYKMMTSNCFYCDFAPDKSLNGIDRMDSMGSYEKKNTVSCCKRCNFIKGCLDPVTFIKRCQHISKHFNGDGILNKEIWSDSKSVPYKQYLTRAAKKDYEFSLTKQQFFLITEENCYYCDKENTITHKNGIDRKDNKIGYTIDNCVSCCRECNYMKAALNDDDFIQICKKISGFNLERIIEIPEIDKCQERIRQRNTNEIPKEKFVITKQQLNKEKQIKEPLEEYTPKQRLYTNGTNLPKDCNIKMEDIPKYCYYVKASETRGDGFCCSKLHPKQKTIGKDWSTSKSKKLRTEEKYNQLMEYLNSN
jgi:hypothetical protein